MRQQEQEDEQARQALTAMFRRDQVAAPARAARKPPSRYGPGARRWTIAAIVVVFILAPISCIVIYPRFGPVDTMTAFCQDESLGNYARAYALLSPRAQQHITLDRFTQVSNQVNLVSCVKDDGIPFIFGQTQATFTQVAFTTGANQASGTMSFVTVNGAWRVDATSPDLFSLSS